LLSISHSVTPNSIFTDVNYAGMPLCSVDSVLCKAHVRSIMDRPCVDMQLHGSLFADDCDTGAKTGAISSAFPSFYIEPLAHEDPATYKASGIWVLEGLLEGHKYFIILPASSKEPWLPMIYFNVHFFNVSLCFLSGL